MCESSQSGHSPSLPLTHSLTHTYWAHTHIPCRDPPLARSCSPLTGRRLNITVASWPLTPITPTRAPNLSLTLSDSLGHTQGIPSTLTLIDALIRYLLLCVCFDEVLFSQTESHTRACTSGLTTASAPLSLEGTNIGMALYVCCMRCPAPHIALVSSL